MAWNESPRLYLQRLDQISTSQKGRKMPPHRSHSRHESMFSSDSPSSSEGSERSDAGVTTTSIHLDNAIGVAMTTIDRNLITFADSYPHDVTLNGVYPVRQARKGYPPGSHTGWTTGFWPGMLWLAYELTGADKYRSAGEVQVERFADRLVRKIDVDHHDIGFLYSLACLAAYRLTGNQLAHQTALRAADQLMTRFLDVPGI